MSDIKGVEELFDLSSTHGAWLATSVSPWSNLGAPLRLYLEELIAANDHPIAGKVHPGAHLEGSTIVIGEGSVVEPGAYIRGPAVIGRNTEVRQGAYIRGDALIGDGCVVGHATELKASIMLDGSKAGHFAYVGDSILGKDVNLGAGTKLANFKLTADEIFIRQGQERLATGRRKLGAILGDGCQTGCNSVTSPGTLMGKGCFVYPCVSVRARWYPPGSRLT